MATGRTLIGIDGASKKTGIAVIVNGKLKGYQLIDLHKMADAEERMTEMTKQIIDACRKHHPDVIYMEDTWVSQNPRSSKVLTTILGGVRYWATEASCQFYTILPSAWRKILGINPGKAKREELKQLSMSFVKEHFCIDAGDDVSDAICIAIAGEKKEKEK